MNRELFARYAHRMVSVILLGAFFTYLYFNDYSSAVFTIFILFLVHLPSLLKNYFSFYLPLQLDAAIGIFVFLSLFLGVLHNFYGRYSQWDSFLHFQSGLLLSIGGFVLMYSIHGQNNKRLRLTPGFIAFSSFNFSIAASVLWEIYEFIADMKFDYGMQQGGNPDTMTDLILNVIGALIISTTAYIWMRVTSKLPLTQKPVDN